MLYCNLAVLLAERNLKITKVSKDTGISRTTLTSLATNKSQGIQFETLNKLCLHLNVPIEQFIQFIPFDFHVEIYDFDRYPRFTRDDFDIVITIYEQKKKHICTFVGKPTVTYKNNDNDGQVLSDIDVDIELPKIIDQDKMADTLFGFNLIKGLPSYFQMEIGSMVTDAMLSNLYQRTDDVIFTSVGWFNNSNNLFA